MTVRMPAELFNERQWQAVQELLRHLDSRQMLWLSGYLAAQEMARPQAEAASAPAGKILITFGSETGNCENLARQLGTRAAEQGIAAEVASLASIRLRQLAKCRYALLLCSTHGDGEPPEPALPFFEALMEEQAPRLPDLEYAILALGDSSYEHFCATGRQLDERLAMLGARPLLPRQECDVDFAGPAREWIQNVLATLPHAPTDASATLQAARTERRTAAKTYSKQSPLEVEVLSNIRLSASDRRAPIHHVELALEASEFPLEPGDALGVLADNPPALVAFVLNATGLSGEQPVSLEGRALPLVQALRQERNLTVPGKRFLEVWAELSGSTELRRIATDAVQQKHFLNEWQVRDLLGRFPAHPDPQTLVDALRPLQPRLYDVASSLRHRPDELHLTVSQYRYPFRDREEIGIASEYLLSLQPGDRVRIYSHRNARFHLPPDPQVPLILMAEGAGIAPYRAFVQEILSGSRHNPCWLIFGEQHFEQDFLYQLDWQAAHKAGVLQRIDPVFYGDEPGRTLASVFKAEMPRLRDWLDRGAHLYFCGDKERLGQCENDVVKSLFEADAAEWPKWEHVQQEKRIHRNLY